MRLGGVDPSILRELSGVYKPFAKAFKELVSNAFDADAECIRVEFADNFSSVTIIDDGHGMTPFEFRDDFTRIGGGSRRWAGGKTSKGRLRIGNKGIGFLALARYCERLVVESAGERGFQCEVELVRTPDSIDIPATLGLPLSSELLSRCLSYQVSRTGPRRTLLKEGRDYTWRRGRRQLAIPKDVGPVKVKLAVDCNQVVFKALLDFDRLLCLADNADLEKIEDFASIEIYDRKTQPPFSGTRVCAEQLKDFVRRELRMEQRKGFVRNIGSRSGFEQFRWSLSRCTPIPYMTPVGDAENPLADLLTIPPDSALSSLQVSHGETSFSLRRPLYPFEPDSPSLPPDMLTKVEIDEGGLKAVGFLAGYIGIIFPAEYRGLSIRVRSVAIGDPGFLGAETLLTGAPKAALSQITGEINILAGLDAVGTLNPGRESFYEESEHFKILKRALVGEGERVGGYLGGVIDTVLRRSSVRSGLSDVLNRAALRRQALEDMSAAITQLIARGDGTARALLEMVRSRRSHANGLASASMLESWIPPRIGGLAVKLTENLTEPATVNYETSEVNIDEAGLNQERTLLLFDRQFSIIHKKGQPDQPIAEMDPERGEIFINWGHPARLQMDERGFLRTSLAWLLAKEAAKKDSDLMMDLALRLLSFNAVSHG